MIQREIEYKRIHIGNDARNNRIIYCAKCPFDTKEKESSLGISIDLNIEKSLYPPI